MRYFNASSQPYVSDFVPQDLNLIYKMQQDMVNEDNNALLNLEKAKTAFNLTGGKRTSSEAQKLSQAYNQEVNKISEGLASGKLNSKDATRQILTLSNHFATNPEVKTVKLDESLLADVNKNLEANPGFYNTGIADAWDSENRQWKKATAGITEDELRQGYNLYNSSPYYEKQNYGEFYDRMKADLTKEFQSPIYDSFKNPDGSINTSKIVNGTSIKQLSEDKARKLVKAQMEKDRNSFINTPVGRYEFKKNPNLTDEQFIEKVVAGNPGYFKEEQDFQKSGGSWSTPGQTKQTEVPIAQLDTGSFDTIDNNQDLNTIFNSLDSNGNISKTLNRTTAASPESINNVTSMGGFPLFDIQNNEPNKKYDEQVNLVKNIRQSLPDITKGLKNDKEVLELYKNIVAKSGQVSHNPFTLEGLDTDKITQNVMTNLSGKKIKITGDNESSTLEAIAAKLGWTVDDLRGKIKDSKVNAIKPISNNNSGSFKVTVYDNKNIPREITIEGNKDQQKYFKEYNELMENDNKALIGEKQTDNYYSVTRLTEGDDGPEFGTVIFKFADGTTTEKEIENKFGSLENAENQGYKFVRTKKGDYKLITEAVDPTELGRELVTNFNHNYQLGLKNYKKK